LVVDSAVGAAVALVVAAAEPLAVAAAEVVLALPVVPGQD